jgi:hypothetical protein
MTPPLAFLFSTGRLLQHSNRVHRIPGGMLGRQQWVVSRSCCLYQCFDLGDLPVRERQSALVLRVSLWSPFEKTGHCLVWQQPFAMVWIWDEAERKKKAHDHNASRVAALPESLLVPKPVNARAVRMVSCLDGVEAQVWDEGILTASHWWQEIPPKKGWQRFLQANGLDASKALPSVEKHPWLEKPWAKSSWEKKHWTGQAERFLVCAAVFAFVLIFSWQGVTAWRYLESVKAMDEKIGALSDTVDPILAARSQALDLEEKIEILCARLSMPSQIRLMALASEKIARQGAAIRQWHFTNGKLAIHLADENPNPMHYVKKIQHLPVFSNAATRQGQGPGMLVLTMDVEKKQIP